MKRAVGDEAMENAFAEEKKKDSRLVPRFSLSLLSGYRTELMGISILGVIICHACQHCVLPPLLRRILSLGNICVDLFLFLGGMGMYFSLQKVFQKQRGEGLGSWYK